MATPRPSPRVRIRDEQHAGPRDIGDDHGQLSGLSDDDHPQYLNVARGDARYYTQADVDENLGVLSEAIDAEQTAREAADAALDTRVDTLENAVPGGGSLPDGTADGDSLVWDQTPDSGHPNYVPTGIPAWKICPPYMLVDGGNRITDPRSAWRGAWIDKSHIDETTTAVQNMWARGENVTRDISAGRPMDLLIHSNEIAASLPMKIAGGTINSLRFFVRGRGRGLDFTTSNVGRLINDEISSNYRSFNLQHFGVFFAGTEADPDAAPEATDIGIYLGDSATEQFRPILNHITVKGFGIGIDCQNVVHLELTNPEVGNYSMHGLRMRSNYSSDNNEAFIRNIRFHNWNGQTLLEGAAALYFETFTGVQIIGGKIWGNQRDGIVHSPVYTGAETAAQAMGTIGIIEGISCEFQNGGLGGGRAFVFDSPWGRGGAGSNVLGNRFGSLYLGFRHIGQNSAVYLGGLNALDVALIHGVPFVQGAFLDIDGTIGDILMTGVKFDGAVHGYTPPNPPNKCIVLRAGASVSNWVACGNSASNFSSAPDLPLNNVPVEQFATAASEAGLVVTSTGIAIPGGGYSLIMAESAGGGGPEPTTYVEHTYTHANGTNVTAASPETGTSPAMLAGTAEIQSNGAQVLTVNSVPYAVCDYGADVPSGNVKIVGTLNANGANIGGVSAGHGLVARVQDSDHFILLYGHIVDDAGTYRYRIELYLRNAGYFIQDTADVEIAGGATESVNRTLELEIVGNDITGRCGSAVVTATLANFAAAGGGGWFGEAVDARCLDILITDS